MEQKRLEPMGVGGLLDRSFAVYRQHFATFFLLALILFAPLMLLQEALMSDMGSMPLLASDNESDSFEEFLQNRFLGSDQPVTEDPIKLLLFLLLLIPISLFVVYPQMQGASLLITKGAVYGEPITLKAALKQSFSRFWPMAGSTFVYGLIVLGIMIGFMLVIGLLSVLGIGVGGLLMPDLDSFNPVLMILLFILLYLLFILVIVLLPGYFLLRWAFYLPVVLIERDGIGIGRSWRLTKGKFWRLVALYIVLTVIYTIFSGGIQALLIAVFGVSVLGQLLLVLFTCLLVPWMMIVYALTYLDLKVRYDGTDVEALLQVQTEPVMTNEKPDERP
ncbi:ABC transporter ATP-binding protein [Brevibacillus ruminantium]|uniref:ABC transporter ATP-binding protein n=1 Tax=Brevibacillus ruminantium TaxID=2950604 RepID=A0ABY4WKK3_9BACL|nr:ABC transporter ATP-binding protein [Brevibacillus ruminantium]USG67693.1 ABC transporter ATP-binding protein [Brevibacillus ruminantium]